MGELSPHLSHSLIVGSSRDNQFKCWNNKNKLSTGTPALNAIILSISNIQSLVPPEVTIESAGIGLNQRRCCLFYKFLGEVLFSIPFPLVQGE